MQLSALTHTTAQQRRSLSAHPLGYKPPVVAGAGSISRRTMSLINDVDMCNHCFKSNGLVFAWVTALPRDIFVHRVARERSQLRIPSREDTLRKGCTIRYWGRC